MRLCVMPFDGELSYRLKCVTVADERVFGELVVTKRNSAAELQQVAPRGGRNLTKQYLEGPDFLELERNNAKPARDNRPDPKNCRFGRSKSWDCAADRHEPPDDDATSLASDGGRRPKIYPVPPTRSSSIDSSYSLSSLVERLLFDIYGTTDVDKHESDSTNPSTWYQRQPPLQNKRLQRKGEPIIGGYKSKILFHPWLASIQENDRHNCVGSIISENVILTAGHCVEKPANPYIVRVGSSRTDSNGSWHRVVAKKLHGKYSRPFGNSVNDVGLLKVSPSFQFGTNVKKVKLVEAGYEVTPGTSVNVAGWGSVSHNGSSTFELMSTNLFIVSSRDCSKAYGDSTGMVIRDHSLICASSRNTDTCNGDSGAPLLLGDIQIGIVSMGIGCADPKYPGIYADVARYRSWIDANAN